jgi:hypothetical protein
MAQKLRIRNIALKLLNFYFNGDPNPAFHSHADPDPDPASKNNADPDITRDGLSFILGGITPVSDELLLVYHD